MQSIDSSGEALDVLAWGMQLPALPVLALLPLRSKNKSTRKNERLASNEGAFSKSFWQTTEGKICQKWENVQLEIFQYLLAENGKWRPLRHYGVKSLR